MNNLSFVKSSFSAVLGCVAVAATDVPPIFVAIIDSKDKSAERITLFIAESTWQRFIAAIKRTDFHDLLKQTLAGSALRFDSIIVRAIQPAESEQFGFSISCERCGDTLEYTPHELAAFVDGVRAGEFDDVETISRRALAQPTVPVS